MSNYKITSDEGKTVTVVHGAQALATTVRRLNDAGKRHTVEPATDSDTPTYGDKP